MPDTDLSALEIFSEQKTELRVARSLVTKACNRAKAALLQDPSPKVIASIRASQEEIISVQKRMEEAAKAVRTSKLLEESVKEAEYVKQEEYSQQVADVAFEIRTFLLQHDPEDEKNVSRRESDSIQHDKTVADPKASSTMIGQGSTPTNTRWKELLQRIEKFDGTPTKFARWNDAFSLYVDSTQLDPLEKFHLLRKTVNEKVLKCIASLRVTGENYESARDTIGELFGNQFIAEDQHVDTVLEMCNRRDIQSNKNFVHFVVEVTQSIQSLVTLGSKIEGMSAFASRVILRALPYDRKRRFDDAYEMQDPEDRPCRLEALMDFLYAEQKQVGRLSLMCKPGSDQDSKESDRESKFKKPMRANNFQSRFNGRRFNPAGPTGSFSNEHAFAGVTSQGPNLYPCIFCSGSHRNNRCGKQMPPEERRKCAATKGVCFKCLGRGHSNQKCNAKGCAVCKQAHHTLLCLKPAETVNPALEVSAGGEMASVNSINIVNVSEKRLPTGYVEVISDEKRSIGRIVLDTGSQKTLITNRFADKLNAKQVGTDVFYLHSAGNATPKRCNGRTVEITIKSRFSDDHMMIYATALPNVVEGHLPRANFKGKLSPIADINEHGGSTEIDILVGVDYLYPMLGTSLKKVEGYIAMETLFGYFLCGTGQHQEIRLNPLLIQAIQAKRENWAETNAKKQQNSVVSLGATVRSKYAPDDISFLWDTEVMGIEPYYKEEDEAPDEEMMKFFRETTTRNADGRYMIHLPFKPNKDTLGDNRELTLRRLRSFLNQAKKDPMLLGAVDDEIEDLLKQGFIELTEAPKPGEQVHYVPLLAVVKKPATENTKMKIRLVNDASARSWNQAGLNDVLYQGQNLIADIIRVILQFRQAPIAITADIERAYLQFEIAPQHRTFLRFLWPLGISKNERAPIREFRSCRLSFGLVSAPFCHCAGIILHLENEMKRQPEHKELLEFVKEFFYVDDVVARAREIGEGKRVVEILHDAFKAGCFPLKKWSTSSPELGRFIQEKYPDAAVTFDNENFKFLGVRWNQKADKLHIDVSKTIEFFKRSDPSKRSLLKGSSQIFDPIGIVAPIALGFKKLLQTHWLKKTAWDQVLSDADLDEYRETASRLENVKYVSIQRNFTRVQGPEVKRELHVFCDASLTAYGCVAYAREVEEKGAAAVTFIMAKGRVAPLKGNWSIHRLELLGAVVAVRIATRITQATADQFASVHFWCDNACVLAWIRDDATRWKNFVQNRIVEIQSTSTADQWRYVRTKENPADLLSRHSALETEQLREFWMWGPEWLRSSGRPQRHGLNPTVVEAEIANEKKAQVFIGAAVLNTDELSIKRMSSWPRTVRVVAYVLRITRFNRELRTQWTSTITAEEYVSAETLLIRNIQRRHFTAELKAGLTELSNRSTLYPYDPFLDQDGLIRVRTRLSNLSDIEYEQLNPIILPGEDDLVGLYVRWIHESVLLHSGSVPGILQKVRERFLILRGRRAAKKAIGRCKTCIRFRAKPAREPVPHLPNFRVETAAPFSTTGVDAAGPITIKDRQGQKVPVYIMMFVCPATRAIRLELVENLSTYEFLLAMRRFFNRNPTVTQFYSDNAASFRRAAKEIKWLYDLSQSDETQEFLTKHRITWKFVTERAPWRNGAVERCFAMVKAPLRKVLGRNLPAFRELETLLTDIEKIVNDRPLGCVSNDPNEILPIRPSDLLYGVKTQPGLPDIGEVMRKVELADASVLCARWKHQQSIINAFWQRFRQDYLMHLRTNVQARQEKSRPLEIGDIVIIKDPAPSRSYWPMARVVASSGGEGPSGDGRKRTFIVKLPSGKTLRRPNQLLYRLDVAEF